MASVSAAAADWLHELTYDALPSDVADRTKLRILDYLGLALAGSVTAPGRAMHVAAKAMGASGPSHILGFGDAVMPGAAALANGTFANALVFDDTHQETIIHVTTPVVSSALAIAELADTNGREFLTAVAGGIELCCRVGLVAPRQFHKHGLHPTGLIGAVASSYVASKLLRLDPSATVSAIGIVGSMSSGISEAFADGTWSHLLNGGWGAQSGIAAAMIAKSGFSGPATALEGRFGLFRSHLQDPALKFDFARMLNGLGQIWESRGVAPKLYPCAHVIHPFLDAALRLAQEHRFVSGDVERVTCFIAAWMIPVVCTPVAEKRRPVSDFQARTSLQYSLAEAICLGRLGAAAYAGDSLQSPSILALADRVEYAVDNDAPASVQYKGWVCIDLQGGRRLERVVMHGQDQGLTFNMADKVRLKFAECLEAAAWSRASQDIADEVMALDKASSVTGLVRLCTEVAESRERRTPNMQREK